MTSDTHRGQLVLVVLSSEQREAYAAELERLSLPGIDLRFEESPDAGIDIAKTSVPALVIVGMTVGMIEGLEFLALLMRARPDYPGKVVVLPDKGDPFSPVLQARDPATGKSTTETIDFGGVESLIISMLEARSRSVAAESPTVHAPTPPVATPAPTAKAPAPPAAEAGLGAGPAARLQAPSQTTASPTARAQVVAPRPAPRPATSSQWHGQKAATPALLNVPLVQAMADGVASPEPSALAPPAEARQAPHPPGPESPFQAVTIPAPPSQDEPTDTASEEPQGPSQVLTVPAPGIEEWARASAAVVTSPAVVPSTPLASWSSKLGERRAVAISAIALLAVIVAVIAAATLFAHSSSAVPDTQSSPQSTHS
jgi:hypothetical protein